MKKLLSILFILFCVFQLIVLAESIDVGSAAIERASGVSTYTMIDLANPANATGTITSLQLYTSGMNSGNVQVATFYLVSGTDYSTRDYCTLGALDAGLETVTTDIDSNPISLDIETGDYIGCYVATWEDGAIYYDESGGSGVRYTETDSIPCSETSFSLLAGYAISLYGTGETAGGGIPVKFNGATITKWNGVEITGWNGVE